MEHTTPSGDTGRRPVSIRAFGFLLLLSLFSLQAFGQVQPSCATITNLTSVHAEGLAEDVGDIAISCTGGTPGSTVAPQFFVGLGTNITNRVNAAGDVVNVNVTITGASGTVNFIRISGAAALNVGTTYTVPSSPTPVIIRISNLRAAVASVAGLATQPVLTATIIGIGVQLSGGDSIPLVLAQPTLLTTALNNGIPCAGSALPASADLPSFLAGPTYNSSVRVTEGWTGGFAPKAPTADTGVRILVPLSGYGTASRIFVPDAVVGNSAGATATSSGAFGTSPAPGSYTPGSSQFLLIRVAGADANGAGGSLAIPVPAGPTTFSSVSEIPLNNGAGFAVYEVVDANPALTDSAAIPVFVVVPPNSCSTSLQANVSAFLGPVSSVATATTSDPIPRFVLASPGSDCALLGDCGAAYVPHLTVSPNSISISGNALGPAIAASVQVNNQGGGQIPFRASVSYTDGSSGWLSVAPASGVNTTNLTVFANPAALSQGIYNGAVTVDAGAYGIFAIPVTFNVAAAGVTIQSIVNAANSIAGPVAPGSFATVYGLNLAGRNVSVIFNGYPATVVFNSATQINLIVPPALGSATAAGVYVTVDGTASNTYRLNLAPNAPAVFNPGILNQDNSVNTTAAGAARGEYVQIFLTGLATPLTGPVTVTLGGQPGLVPVYAGPVPSIPGLEQVNVQVPVTLPAGGSSAPLSVCVPGTDGTPLCSAPVPLYLR